MFTFPLMLAAVSLPTPVAVGGVFAIAALGGAALFAVGQKREQLKRELIQLSQVAEKEGLPSINNVLEDVAVDDFSGLFVHVRNLLGSLRNPETRRQVVLPFLKTQLVKWAKGEDGRNPADLKAFIEDALGVTVTLTPKPPVAPPG